MAELRAEVGDLGLHPAAAEKTEAVHGDVRVVRSQERRADDAHAPADIGVNVGNRGVRVVEAATVRSRWKKLFAAVHHDTSRGVRVAWKGACYDKWIVGCADPEGVIAALAPQG